MKAFVLALARCSTDDVNATVSARDLRTSLHLACAMGNLAMAQLLIWVSFRNPQNPFQKMTATNTCRIFRPHRIMPTSNKLTTKDALAYRMRKQPFLWPQPD